MKIRNIHVFLLIILTSCTKYDKSDIESLGILKEIENFKEYTIEVTAENQLDTILIKTFIYNNKGKLIESEMKYNRIDSDYIAKYKYNSKNELIQEIGKSNETESPIIINYKRFNDTVINMSLEMKMESYDLVFRINGQEIYSTNNILQKIITKEYYVNLGTKDTTINQISEIYYKNGFVNKSIWKSYDSLVPNSNYEFIRNEKNLITKTIIYSNENKTETTFDYEFDDYGSWIKQNEYDDGKLIKIKSRRITYK